MTNPNIVPMVEFLTDNVKPLELAEIIDDVLFEYIYGKIEAAESGDVTSEIKHNISLMRELRDVLHLL